MCCMCHLCEQKCLQQVPKAVKCQIMCPQENSRQTDRHKKRLVFRTLTGNSEVGVSRSPRAAERRWRRPWTSEMGLHSSARYLGAMPCKDLYTVTQILYNTRRGRSNQWYQSPTSYNVWPSRYHLYFQHVGTVSPNYWIHSSKNTR